MNSVRYPIRSGFVGHNGTPVWLDENTAWDGDDPFVKANAEKFEERDPFGVPIPVEPEPSPEPEKKAEPEPESKGASESAAESTAAKSPRKPKNG